MGHVQRQGTETLQLANCPCCKKDTIKVWGCSYTSFNPGHATCLECKREWSLGFVIDMWDAGERWNKLEKQIKEFSAMLDLIHVKKQTSVSRDFHLEELEEKAEVFLQKIKNHIILHSNEFVDPKE